MNDIILMALPAEAPNFKNYPNVIFTGLGKINAASACTEAILKFKPKRIFNFGTAGGITVSKGLHKIGKFVQRDMLCEPLGYAPGVTPFEENLKFIEFGEGLTCSTGDNFVNDNELKIPADVVDMEAYALAKVCKRYSTDFICFKYITDGGDKNAGDDWQNLVQSGEDYYWQIVEEYKINLGIN